MIQKVIKNNKVGVEIYYAPKNKYTPKENQVGQLNEKYESDDSNNEKENDMNNENDDEESTLNRLIEELNKIVINSY